LKGEKAMKKITIQCALCGMLAALVVGGMPVPETDACTRAVYLGPEDTIITVRSMDWKGDTKTNLWAFPRGLNRDGAAGPNSIRWTSKYGSLVAAGWDVGTADGMNEKGLVANMLYLVESARSPNVFWVNLADLDFAAGRPTKKLTLTGGAIFAGNAAEKFQPAAPFKFLPATVK
jgi:penicillin V acylase-like amidase (Ntn superfamily)